MVKKSKLLSALDAEKGRDYEAEKRKKVQKKAEKTKRLKSERQLAGAGTKPVETITNGEPDLEAALQDDAPTANDDFEAFGSGDEEADDEEAENGIIPQPDTAAEASASEAEQDSDVDYSDLEEEDREDVVPHQRMTINNGPALTASRKRVAIVSDKPKHPFHFHNSLVSTDQTADELIPDAMDDETRELMFYKIARDATITARGLLKKEKVPFSRPADYFAEMVKTDDHMDKVKKKLYDEASSKRAAEEARRMRDAKKFGKQVQIAKEQERAKDKKDTLNKIKDLKRSECIYLTPTARLLTRVQNAKTQTLAESLRATTSSRKSTSIPTRRNRDQKETQIEISGRRKIRSLVLVVRSASASLAQLQVLLICAISLQRE